MKITDVTANNRKKLFEVKTRRGTYTMPYAVLDLPPTADDKLVDLYIDEELAREGFSYTLASGREGTVHIDHVLHYNEDPKYLSDFLLHQLTVEAKRRFDDSEIGVRQIARQLKTSPAQIYRLLDPANNKKSVKRMLDLLYALNCRVDFVVHDRAA